ncbi:sugar phosphate nucleotidyltransferase [Crossiella cryophila]|uniref:Glucose-1-phosphate thymidylyltransferase n=1 Tax=Crossiella cryophila TaxID=43355 RepID=A0A7W7CCT1_9PSEU|nr:sugar phosphate nucleotidyltransferase [Crossiella cryophila]MBB4678735.1 dTDP-glucose pyrophosphorylase [Crossiella cryophila]
MLGDNIFQGTGFSRVLTCARKDLDQAGRLVSMEEKPSNPKPDQAITGLYCYDNDVFDIARGIKPSDRGELEITDVNRVDVEQGRGQLIPLGHAMIDSAYGRYVMEVARTLASPG